MDNTTAEVLNNTANSVSSATNDIALVLSQNSLYVYEALCKAKRLEGVGDIIIALFFIGIIFFVFKCCQNNSKKSESEQVEMDSESISFLVILTVVLSVAALIYLVYGIKEIFGPEVYVIEDLVKQAKGLVK